MKYHALIAAVVFGVIDPNCTIKDICPHVNETSGSRQRPPSSYTNALKAKDIKALGLDSHAIFELDHVVPICLCGATSDPNNLIPEPWPQAKVKDRYEASFHKAVCAGKMKLEDAQKQIVTYE